MPLQATSGAASYDAFGGGVAAVPNYIEDVFSTYLYTGNGSTQTINNGIDLAGEGGLVWIKNRTTATTNALYDTLRGNDYILKSNSTAISDYVDPAAGGLSSFNSGGFSLRADTVGLAWWNASSNNYASWTFRKQPKFFDVVTWTGSGSARTIAHNLNSVPGCIIVKRTDTAADWAVYHRSAGEFLYFTLNSSSTFTVSGTVWNGTLPTSTVFSVGGDSIVNASGGTYVAYLFAHNAGGFGLTGTDNVISCGSFTTDGSGNATVTLGYEPQWILSKASGAAFDWEIADVMRGMSVGTAANALYPNLSSAESTGYIRTPTATGFNVSGVAGANTFIYIAIRRGPMKTPTTGTSVFDPELSAATAGTAVTTNFPVDLQIAGVRAGFNPNFGFSDRLRGISSTSTEVARYLTSTSTNAESTATDFRTRLWGNTGYAQDAYLAGAGVGIYWNFRRAPSVFDEVCYTGTGSATTFSHNLTVVPELMIVKGRTGGFTSWHVYNAASASANDFLRLQTTGAYATDANIFGTRPTSTVFSVGASTGVNGSGTTYVAYLFATCPGVSKVGSFTGTGTTQTINCGFTGGARFVLIKRTDQAGSWHVWDSARGIVAGNDPYLELNTVNAEVTNTDWVDAAASGFELSNAGGNNANTVGATYIFLAIA